MSKTKVLSTSQLSFTPGIRYILQQHVKSSISLEMNVFFTVALMKKGQLLAMYAIWRDGCICTFSTSG